MIKKLIALVYTTVSFCLFVVTLNAQCPPNIDFEQGNFNNWQTYIGSVRDSGNMNFIKLVASGVTPTRHTIISASTPPAVDQYGGFPVLCPNGSGYSVKLGNNQTGKQAEGISYTFTVPLQNDFSLVYNYAVVFEDPNHQPYQQPRFNAKVFDVAANQYITCASFEYIATANLPGFQSVTVGATVVRYKSWTPVSINLRGYAGRQIRLEFSTADCTLGAHFGYAYLDVACASIVTGDNPFCAGKTSISLSGPFGFQGYQWSLNNFTTVLDTSRTITLTPPPANNTPLSLVLIPYVGFGCRDTIKTFIRENPLPTANAGIDKAACKGTPVQIGTAGLPNTSYSWHLIPSVDSTLAQPFVTPAITTDYYLTAKSDTGAHCISKDTVRVTPHIVDTSMKVTGQGNVCKATSVHVQMQLLSPPPTIQWYVNGVPVLGATSATFNADSFGLYYAVVKDSFCTDTTRKINIGNASTTVGFTVNQQGQCLDNNVFLFTNTTTSSDSLHFSWSFGDGGTATTVNAIHTYSAPGIYEVKLIVINSLGCPDTLIKSVEVYAMPSANFSVVLEHCYPDTSFRFINASGGGASYDWSFGDGGTSTDVSPFHSFPVPGTYLVRLITISSNGCRDTIFKTVIIYPKPIAAFSVNNTSQCLNSNSFTFTNTSTPLATSTYLWKFGDGSTSTVTSPTHVYASTGTYIVTLIVTGDHNCKDSIKHTVIVSPKPVAGFSVNAVQCLPDINFVFTNTSSSAISYQWSFGDGGASTAVNPSYAYATAGTYTVTLIAIGSGGCRDTITKPVTLQARATAGFTITTTSSQCLYHNSFTFTNTSTLGVVSTYLWQFGDGTTSAATSPSHSYTSPGTYIIKLVVTSGTSCKDSISRTVTVYPMPVAGFTVAAVQCQPNNSFTFTNTSTISSGTSIYQWSFGDGGTSAATSPSHVYANAGTYSTKLVVVSNHGCRDSIVKTVKLYPKATAGFTVNTASQCYNHNIFTFTNTSSPAGTTPSYLWLFGDSITSTATSPTHIYTTAGTYSVMLIAFSGNGCKDTLIRTVNVYAKPTVAFTANTASQCLADNRFVFSNGSSISIGSMTYRWYFGDGSTTTGTNPTHIYAAAGTYIVKLVATSNNGCKDSIAHTLMVKPSPAASFTINDSTQCMNGGSFRFTNTSSPAGAPAYTWSFGDGVTSALTSPVHVYSTGDTFTVTLVSNLNGCKDSTSHTVIVYPKPTLAFTANAASQCLPGNRFVFANGSSISSGSVVAYLWHFGDGSTLPGTNPAHVYAAIGTYIVKLVATSNKGCKDSIAHTMTVKPSPVALFRVNDSTQCVNGNSFGFTNTSINPPGTPVFSWSFGDGGMSAAASPVHIYSTAGTFSITFIANTNGCKDTAAKFVVVYPKPLPSFDINIDQQCLSGNNFQFTNTSTITSGIITHVWIFGDGVTATTSNASHVYASSGTRTVKLVATSNNLCKDSISHTVVVFDQLPPPIASVDSASIGANNVTFTWLPVAGATGYQVSVNNGPFMTPSSGINGLKHVVTNLAAQQNVTFRVRALGVSLCRTSEPATIAVTTKTDAIFIPNTFTPNGDGHNDYLTVYGNGMKSVKVAVFNQFGQKISESADLMKGWDGTFNGKPQPAGVYVYAATITLNDNSIVVKHGSVNLIR